VFNYYFQQGEGAKSIFVYLQTLQVKHFVTNTLGYREKYTLEHLMILIRIPKN